MSAIRIFPPDTYNVSIKCAREYSVDCFFWIKYFISVDAMGKEKQPINAVSEGVVSVVVVCYNETRDRICRTLSSVVGQTYKNVEIVVVDGGSNRESISAFDEFSSDISFFISEPDEGIYDAMNKGVSHSNGEWVMFINVGDSLYSKSTLQNFLTNGNMKYDILYGDIYREDMNITSKPPKYINRFMFYSSYFCHQSLLFRRQLFTQVGLFDLSYKLLADRDWIFKAYVDGASFKYEPILVCSYEGGGVSTNSQTVNRELMEMRKKSFSKAERMFYLIINFTVKIYKRLLTGNFNIPIIVKKLFSSRY